MSTLVLGIESSCDETSAAVVENGEKILSNVVHSQIDVHREWGGVVPELASRHHAEQIDLIINLALSRAEVKLDDIDIIAVTYGPGLVGALLVGMAAAKGIALAKNLPLVGVDHIQAHIHSVELDHKPMEYPAVSLVISGGHTSLFYQKERFSYELLSQTRDDAAGEAYDKVAKLLNLGYPGGPVIDRLAKLGNDRAIRFTPVKMSDGSLDFSFSGLKTAVLTWTKKHPHILEEKKPEESKEIIDLVASFQRAVISEVTKRIRAYTEKLPVKSIGISGGVSMNSALRVAVSKLGEDSDIPVFLPHPSLTGDNAAMIAALGYHKFIRRGPDQIHLNANPNLKVSS